MGRNGAVDFSQGTPIRPNNLIIAESSGTNSLSASECQRKMKVADFEGDPDRLLPIAIVNHQERLAGRLQCQIPLGSDPQCLAGFDLNSGRKRDTNLAPAIR